MSAVNVLKLFKEEIYLNFEYFPLYQVINSFGLHL